MRHLILLLFFSVLGIGIIWGQDPVLSQYFNAPLINNPALVSYGKKSMHVYSNYRQQWVGPGSSYNTMLASITGKVLKGYSSLLQHGHCIILVDDYLRIFIHQQANARCPCSLLFRCK